MYCTGTACQETSPGHPFPGYAATFPQSIQKDCKKVLHSLTTPMKTHQNTGTKYEHSQKPSKIMRLVNLHNQNNQEIQPSKLPLFMKTEHVQIP